MRVQVLLLAVICISSVSNLLAQRPYFEGETDGDFRLLLLPGQQKLTFHQWNNEAYVSLYGENNKLIDQLPIDYKSDEISETILAALGENRYFLQAGSESYNFHIESDKISLLETKALPKAPRGTIKTIFFFDAQKSLIVFINEREQYNVYIDSAGTSLKRTETYGTSHQGGVQKHPQRPQGTPVFIYSQAHKELFIHLPTDVSFLVIGFNPPDILKAGIYVEYGQQYTFRRYYDEATHQRYLLKEDGEKLTLFKSHGFAPRHFTSDYQAIDKGWILDFTPLGIYNGQLLKRNVINEGKSNLHKFYLIPLNTYK
ncbi:MAG: hypothetical protein HWE21_01395 [Cytophagia bacterium]|nr:hypothetical protein [Cytophagia bacterium]